MNVIIGNMKTLQYRSQTQHGHWSKISKNDGNSNCYNLYSTV